MTAPGPLPDTLAAPVLLEMRDCLRAELARSLAGPVCRAFVEWRPIPPVMDGCTCTCSHNDVPGNGDGWVRLVRLDPDWGPGSDARQRGGCPPGWLATIGLGSYRCMAIPERGEALPEETVTTTSLIAHSDMAAYMRVITCCPALNADADLHQIGRPEVMGFQPIRAADCGGGELLLKVSMRGAVLC